MKNALKRNDGILSIRELCRSCHITKEEILQTVSFFSNRFGLRDEKFVHLLR